MEYTNMNIQERGLPTKIIPAQTYITIKGVLVDRDSVPEIQEQLYTFKNNVLSPPPRKVIVNDTDN
jgi:hypothetical protein